MLQSPSPYVVPVTIEREDPQPDAVAELPQHSLAPIPPEPVVVEPCRAVIVGTQGCGAMTHWVKT